MGDGTGAWNQKQVAYSQLVEKRKACRLCESFGFTNPSICEQGVYDCNGDIGPWTRWQGNLDADLMVIGQDWGGTEYYREHRGLEEDVNPTNKRLRGLLASIGFEIALPRQPQNKASLFFTNSALCLRPGRLTGAISLRSFSNCATAFLRPQIELVNPKVVATLGYVAYRSLLKAYDIRPRPRMREAVEEVIELPTGASLVPVYHPGNNGTRSRTFEEQKLDWQRVQMALDRSNWEPETVEG